MAPCKHAKARLWARITIDEIVCGDCDEVVSISCEKCGLSGLPERMRISPDEDGNRTVCKTCCDELEPIEE